MLENREAASSAHPRVPNLWPRVQSREASTQRPRFSHHFRNLVIGDFLLEGNLTSALKSAPSKMTK